jgi:hypothetical protein
MQISTSPQLFVILILRRVANALSESRYKLRNSGALHPKKLFVQAKDKMVEDLEE